MSGSKSILRKILFWIHLSSGIVAGVVIAIMSATGVAIAFEQEILDWYDSEVNRAIAPPGTSVLPLSELEAIIGEKYPDFQPSMVEIPRSPDRAYVFHMGRIRFLYVDPYSGLVSEPRSIKAHDFLHKIEDWHRWLGMNGNERSFGRLITGTSNAAFLVLCLTGLYLWIPWSGNWRAIRRVLWFRRTKRGKARDFNWHNVLGFWNLPVLIILAGTALVISFAWAHDLVFKSVGEEPPKYRDFRMMLVSPPKVENQPPGTPLLSLDQALRLTKERHPQWEAIHLNYPSLKSKAEDSSKPISLTWFQPASFATAGRVMTVLDPYTGDELQSVSFADRSKGIRARVWIRFLHTGEAFGLLGKIMATVASLVTLLLVYTGFALSWRRFF